MSVSANSTIWAYFAGLELRQSYKKAGDFVVRCLEAGEGPTLLLLHGGGGHAEAYTKNIAALSERFHVVAVDLVGHGYSSIPGQAGVPDVAEPNFDLLVKFIDAVHTAVTDEPVYICGLSFSAVAGALYAGQNPGRVKKLILNTGVPLECDEVGGAAWRRVLQMPSETAKGWSREQVRQRLGVLFKGGADNVPEELIDIRHAIFKRPGMSEFNNRFVRRMMRTVAEPSPLTEREGPEALRNIACETLLVWTPTNPGQYPSVAEKALTFLKKGRLVVFEDSHHWPQWEEAEKFNQLALEFLGE
jgi:2-hydroxy-6-oxonona-2,4-dienedioate hydrolase